uniref:Uncharacterized protein n=1 Tax=Arundo donax TaxID=35708 RepID=A0A0A8XZC2_ARUDO
MYVRMYIQEYKTCTLYTMHPISTYVIRCTCNTTQWYMQGCVCIQVESYGTGYGYA